MVSPAAVTATFSGAGPQSGYECVGNPFVLFTNANTGQAYNGGTKPSFSTGGQPYCLISIATYHWNVGRGSPPGTIGLATAQGALGPWPATGTSGEGGHPMSTGPSCPGRPASR